LLYKGTREFGQYIYFFPLLLLVAITHLNFYSFSKAWQTKNLNLYSGMTSRAENV